MRPLAPLPLAVLPLALACLAAWPAAGVAAPGEPYDDVELERRARERLDRDLSVRRLPVRVSVRSGIARLEGEVETLGQIEAARRAVAQVRGLVHLESALRVPAGLADDARLEEDLRRSLERYPKLQRIPLALDIEDGQARVEGQVPTASERHLVLEAAREVRGLRGLDLRLQVGEGRSDDTSLERRIRGLLSDRVRFPVRGRIDVRVRDGTAILEGRVGRIIDKLEAEEVAWLVGGLRGVQNLIMVVPRPPVRRLTDGSEEEAPAPRPLPADPETPDEETEGSDDAGN